MKKILTTLALLLTAATARADYTFVVPQAPGGGTSVWASIIARELEPHLGEKIVLRHIPGARDIPGFNEFHNSLRKDPKTVMVAHGGNGESFLLEPVDYNYYDYEPIGLMNLTIMIGRNETSGTIKFAAGSGMNPDAMAITLLICGPLKDLQAYKSCFDRSFKYVPGLSGGERRLAFKRGELNATRETPAAFIKHVQPDIDNGEAELWFSHGVFDYRTGKVVADPNYPGASFREVYKQRWKQEPTGPLYDAYMLAKNYRDILQKSLWVDRGNPNAEKLRTALKKMLADPPKILS